MIYENIVEVTPIEIAIEKVGRRHETTKTRRRIRDTKSAWIKQKFKVFHSYHYGKIAGE